MPEVPFQDLDPKEKEVVRALNAARRPLNTNQVSERTGISWKTVDDRLKKLHKKGWVRYRTQGQSKYWRLK